MLSAVSPVSRLDIYDEIDIGMTGTLCKTMFSKSNI